MTAFERRLAIASTSRRRIAWQAGLACTAQVPPPAAGNVARRICARILAAALLAAAAPLLAQPLSLLSFNVEHLMSPARFERWQAFCRPLGWRDPQDASRPEELTYCNALDGSDGRGRRVFAPVHDRGAWEQKVASVSGLVREADADIVLLQEVSDAQAARLVLGPGYQVAGSDELWRDRAIAQNLAIGWRIGRFAQPPRVELVQEVSKAGEDGRATRPGLALNIEVGDGRRLAVLNLHLKAGCRQGRLNESTSRSPEQAFRRKADCTILQQQVPAIERWADAKLREGQGVIIAGDFNRDLLREIRERLPARADGSDPAAPAPPPRIASLVAELSDGDPPSAWFALARTNRYPRRADCHRNIDNFLLSRNIERWLPIPLRQVATMVLPFDEPVSLDKVRPSDHCPHLLRLPLEAARRPR